MPSEQDERPLLTLQQQGIPATEVDQKTLQALQLDDEHDDQSDRNSVLSHEDLGQIEDTLKKGVTKESEKKPESQGTSDKDTEYSMFVWYAFICIAFLCADSFKPTLEARGQYLNINHAVLSGMINVCNMFVGTVGLIFTIGSSKTFELICDWETCKGYAAPGFLFAISQCLNLIQNIFVDGKTRKAFNQFRIPVTAALGYTILNKSYTSLQWGMMVMIMLSVMNFIIMTDPAPDPIFGGQNDNILIGFLFSLIGTSAACVGSLVGEGHMKKTKHLPIFVQRVHFELWTIIGAVSVLFVGNPIFGMIADEITFRMSGIDGDTNLRKNIPFWYGDNGIGNHAYYTVNPTFTDIEWSGKLDDGNTQIYPNLFDPASMKNVYCKNLPEDLNLQDNLYGRDGVIWKCLTDTSSKTSVLSKEATEFNAATNNFVSEAVIDYDIRNTIYDSKTFPGSGKNTHNAHSKLKFRSVGGAYMDTSGVSRAPYLMAKQSSWTKDFLNKFNLHIVQLKYRKDGRAAQKLDLIEHGGVIYRVVTSNLSSSLKMQNTVTGKLEPLKTDYKILDIPDGNKELLRIGQPSSPLPSHDTLVQKDTLLPLSLYSAVSQAPSPVKSIPLDFSAKSAPDLTLTDTNGMEMTYKRALDYSAPDTAGNTNLKITFQREIKNSASKAEEGRLFKMKPQIEAVEKSYLLKGEVVELHDQFFSWWKDGKEEFRGILGSTVDAKADSGFKYAETKGTSFMIMASKKNAGQIEQSMTTKLQAVTKEFNDIKTKLKRNKTASKLRTKHLHNLISAAKNVWKHKLEIMLYIAIQNKHPVADIQMYEKLLGLKKEKDLVSTIKVAKQRTIDLAGELITVQNQAYDKKPTMMQDRKLYRNRSYKLPKLLDFKRSIVNNKALDPLERQALFTYADILMATLSNALEIDNANVGTAQTLIDVEYNVDEFYESVTGMQISQELKAMLNPKDNYSGLKHVPVGQRKLVKEGVPPAASAIAAAAPAAKPAAGQEEEGSEPAAAPTPTPTPTPAPEDPKPDASEFVMIDFKLNGELEDVDIFATQNKNIAELFIPKNRSVTFKHEVMYTCTTQLHFDHNTKEVSKHSLVSKCIGAESAEDIVFSKTKDLYKVAHNMMKTNTIAKYILAFTRPGQIQANACSGDLCRNVIQAHDVGNAEDEREYENIKRNGLDMSLHERRLDLPFYQSRTNLSDRELFNIKIYSPREYGMLERKDPFYYSIYQSARFNVNAIAPAESWTMWMFIGAVVNSLQGWFSMIVSRELSSLTKTLLAAMTMAGCAMCDLIFAPPEKLAFQNYTAIIFGSLSIILPAFLFSSLPGEKKH